jgi:hypothetical protein
MSRLVFGRLTDAWHAEATAFTPLLAEQIDQLGAAIGVDLASVGESEVPTAGGRRIDIVAEGEDGSEFVIENQYGRANHDHMTRGLAYAVARRARGLVIVAEEHRDEFRAVAAYLNDLAELDPERGISVWLVEAKAVRIGDSPWAPLFTAVVEPNSFIATVEQAKQTEAMTYTEFWAQFTSDESRQIVQELVARWEALGYRRRLGPGHVVLMAPGPSKNGLRTVVAVYSDGRVMVPFSAYAGTNSGISIESLQTDEFRTRADDLFGFSGSERLARTQPGWLDKSKAEPLMSFCIDVAKAYASAMTSDDITAESG